MKLNFALLAILGTKQNVFVMGDCMMTDLEEAGDKIHGFKKWDCVPPASEYVLFYIQICDLTCFSLALDGTKCSLVCEENYIPFYLGFRKHHECVLDEWKESDSFDMLCQLNSEL